MSKFVICILLYFGCLTLQGQSRQIVEKPTEKVSVQEEKVSLSEFIYFHPENKNQLFSLKDTSIQHDFTRFDPTKRVGHEHVTLGNTFSPAYRLLYAPRVNVTFHPGYDAYAPYLINFSNFRFYTAKKPQSEGFFSQMGNQLNYSAGARLAIPFKSGWSFSLDYLRVNEKGFFLSHAVKSTNLATGIRYTGKSDRYGFIAGFTQHAQDEENNGGIRLLSELETQPTSSVKTYLNEAKTRHQVRSYSLVQYLTLAGSEKWKLFARHTLIHEPGYYKFSHGTSIADTLYYGDYLQDPRGVRRYLDVKRTGTSFNLHGENKSGFHGQVGIQFDFFNIKNQGKNQKRSDLTATFSGDIPILKALILHAKGSLGLAQNVGNFNSEGSVQLKIKEWAQLKGGVQFFLSEPNYSQENFVVNQFQIFDKKFKKSFGSRFFGSLSIPLTNTNLYISQDILTNPIYFLMTPDQKGKISIESKQSDVVFTYATLQVRQNLRLYNVDFNHALFFQVFNENIFNLPTWYSSHQIYVNLKIFKKALHVSLGGEARLIPDSPGIGYSVLHGQFFSNDQTDLPFVPDVDLVLNAKIKTFRMSVMIENAGHWWWKTHNFDVVDYPRMESLLRFSIRWMFYN